MASLVNLCLYELGWFACVLAVVWSAAFPVLMWVSDRLVVIAGVGDRYRWLS